jgi:hypothetical protein
MLIACTAILLPFVALGTARAQATSKQTQLLFALRDYFFQSGMEAHEQDLQTLNAYADSLEGMWGQKMAAAGIRAESGAVQPPSRDVAVNQAIQAGIQELRASIKQAEALHQQAASVSDKTLAISLARDAISWSDQAIRTAKELSAPVTSYAPSASTGRIASSPVEAGSTASAPSQRPTLESAPGFAQNMSELYQHVDELSNRISTTVPPANTEQGGPPQNTNELFQYLDQLSGRAPQAQPGLSTPASDANAVSSTGEPPKTMSELFRYVDELSGRTPNAATTPTGESPKNTAGLFRYCLHDGSKTLAFRRIL